MKPNTLSLIVFVVLTYFAAPLGVEAVVPAPDGGYPGFNTAEGQNALHDLTSGAANTALGAYSLFSTTTASFNTAVGAAALDLNTGDSNTAVGVATLLLNTGTENTAVGVDALGLNTSGAFNAAVGTFALYNNTTGGSNTAAGVQALISNTTGISNTAIGDNALEFNTTGSNNIGVGLLGGAAITTANHVICIGTIGANVDNTTWIGNVFGVTTQSGTTAPVVVANDGQLGTVVSSARFKKDIATMEKASEAILSLRPVTFHYKTDPEETPQFGLIAEEVAKVNPALVLPDKEGKPYTVRYDAVNAMLLSEFLKEHRKNEQQRKDFEAAIAQQQKQIEALTAGLQKVSAQLAAASPSDGGLELNKPAPQTVLNNR